jgi:hypothetical protein
MDVMACCATQLVGRAVAFTPLKKSHLIAMNVWMLHIGRYKRLEIVTERPARNVRESRRKSFALNSVMAFGA